MKQREQKPVCILTEEEKSEFDALDTRIKALSEALSEACIRKSHLWKMASIAYKFHRGPGHYMNEKGEIFKVWDV